MVLMECSGFDFNFNLFRMSLCIGSVMLFLLLHERPDWMCSIVYLRFRFQWITRTSTSQNHKTSERSSSRRRVSMLHLFLEESERYKKQKRDGSPGSRDINNGQKTDLLFICGLSRLCTTSRLERCIERIKSSKWYDGVHVTCCGKA